MQKLCIKCGVVLVVGENWLEGSKKNGMYVCRPCHNFMYREIREKHISKGLCQAGDKNPLYPSSKRRCKEHIYKDRINRLKHHAINLGIKTHPDVPESLLFEFQDNKCYLCGIKSNGRALHRDHDHRTGWLRGILCSPCNTKLVSAGVDKGVDAAIQHFVDHDLNQDLLLRIIDYLDNPPYFQLLEKLYLPRPTGTYDQYMEHFDLEEGII